MGILTPEKLLAFLELLCDALGGLAIGWIEGLIIAEGTTASTYRAVSVGAGETGIDRYLLYFCA